MGFSRQEYWSGLPCPPPGDLPDPGMEPVSLNVYLHWQAGSLPLAPPWKPTPSGTTLLSEVKVAQSCPTLCSLMDYTVHRIFHARILEWVAFPFSRGSSQLTDQTQVSRIAGVFFTS